MQHISTFSQTVGFELHHLFCQLPDCDVHFSLYLSNTLCHSNHINRFCLTLHHHDSITEFLATNVSVPIIQYVEELLDVVRVDIEGAQILANEGSVTNWLNSV